jgi:hypothetical protein
MKIRGTPLGRGIRKSFFMAFALPLLSAPMLAISAECDGSGLFFSLEDLKKQLSKLDLSHLSPNLQSISAAIWWFPLRIPLPLASTQRARGAVTSPLAVVRHPRIRATPFALVATNVT